jgi:hypothetical protein
LNWSQENSRLTKRSGLGAAARIGGSAAKSLWTGLSSFIVRLAGDQATQSWARAGTLLPQDSLWQTFATGS